MGAWVPWGGNLGALGWIPSLQWASWTPLASNGCLGIPGKYLGSRPRGPP